MRILIKKLARRFPMLRSIWRFLYRIYGRCLLRSNDPRETFTKIYEENQWGGDGSVSGTGSDAEQTETISREIPKLLERHEIRSILDIPCGDYNWMRNVDITGVSYLGADIVEQLTKENSTKYGKNGIQFACLNLISDPLPKADLVLCRDCLVHLSFEDISKALQNIVRSGSRFLLTTTFRARRENWDIVTGQWRVLNLEIAPFFLPEPNEVILEGCSEEDGEYGDKALALWRISEIQAPSVEVIQPSRF